MDEFNPWDFYWGRDSTERCLLVFRFGVETAVPTRLPVLRGLEVVINPDTANTKRGLLIRLLDSELRNVFWRLCEDVLTSAARGQSESEALAITVTRLWSWHHLLRGGSGGMLSPDEQRGLIGELLVLEHYLLPHGSALDAIQTWRGPLGAPQDFVIASLAIECKSNSSRTSDRVRISSEHQLSLRALKRLFLHVCLIDPADGAMADTFTVSDVVSRIMGRLAESNRAACQRFESLLAGAGFRFDDDYSAFPWRGGERSIYEVLQLFPSLTPDTMPEGVSQVAYSLSLAVCSEFLTTPTELHHAIALAVGDAS